MSRKVLQPIPNPIELRSPDRFEVPTILTAILNYGYYDVLSLRYFLPFEVYGNWTFESYTFFLFEIRYLLAKAIINNVQVVIDNIR